MGLPALTTPLPGSLPTRFIDLMFDFHSPLFVKLRTALEYVNSNKASAPN